MTTEEEIRQAFASIKTWARGDERAPHKPLLLLIALSEIQLGQPRLIRYEQIEAPLTKLLKEFGPSREKVHPENPFWRLQKDRLWEIPLASKLTLSKSGDPLLTELRNQHVSGGFTPEIWKFLKQSPKLVNQLATDILNANFPISYHEAILDAIGFPWIVELPSEVIKKRGRDPKFRDTILRIYEHRCAICGFDGRLGGVDLALEAAHIKWHAAHGPDTGNNGLALCTFHHTIFDRGAISLDNNYRVLVSQEVYGQNQVEDWILRFKGQNLRRPVSEKFLPGPAYIKWHQKQVFRHPAR